MYLPGLLHKVALLPQVRATFKALRLWRYPQMDPPVVFAIGGQGKQGPPCVLPLSRLTHEWLLNGSGRRRQDFLDAHLFSMPFLWLLHHTEKVMQKWFSRIHWRLKMAHHTFSSGMAIREFYSPSKIIFGLGMVDRIGSRRPLTSLCTIQHVSPSSHRLAECSSLVAL